MVPLRNFRFRIYEFPYLLNFRKVRFRIVHYPYLRISDFRIT